MCSKYFGTNGVRGKFDILNPELAMALAHAIGLYFKSGKILVARDGRLTGECLKYSVIAGLQSVGCDVIDLDYASAPTAEFMLRKLKGGGLIIITASHNPPEWNALKVVDGDGVAISRERGEDVERLMDGIKRADWQTVGSVIPFRTASEDHIRSIMRLVKERDLGIRVVLDCGNGMAALIAPRLFAELGCNVILLNEKVDGHFPGRPSEPSKENVSELIESVRKHKADCGIAWDGDGDRVIFVDENGKYVVGDRVFALSAIIRLREKKGNVVTTVATSKAIEDIASKYAVKTIYTKIGAPYLSQEMKKGTAVIGGEEVGGVIWPELSLAKDGFFTAAKIVEAMKIREKKLSALLAEVPLYFNKKTKIKCDDTKKQKLISAFLDYANSNKLDAIDVDGVRINFSDSWVIIRASGTEPYIRVFAEAKSEEKAEKLMGEYEEKAKKLLSGF